MDVVAEENQEECLGEQDQRVENTGINKGRGKSSFIS